MSEQPHVPPPPPTQVPPPPPTAGADGAPRLLRHPVALFAAAFAIGLAAAGVVGFGLGGLALAGSTADCSPSDTWCGLGAAIIAVLVGVVTGAIAYIVAGVVTIFRSRPAGSRGQHVLAHLTLPFIAYLALALLSSALR